MSAAKRSPDFVALEEVHSALAPLDPETRGRVLSSVCQLLEVGGFSLPVGTTSIVPLGESASQAASSRAATGSRPLSLIELVQDKNPQTIGDKITLFAYYREKFEGRPNFAREDLRVYFSKAKMPPPGNYDRDFVTAVKNGWIHEDGESSYLTSRGIEAVESGFSGTAKRPRRKSKANNKGTRGGARKNGRRK